MLGVAHNGFSPTSTASGRGTPVPANAVYPSKPNWATPASQAPPSLHDVEERKPLLGLVSGDAWRRRNVFFLVEPVLA